MTARAALALTLLSLAGAAGCGPSARPPPPARQDTSPQWADVFDGTPDLYAVLRPQAIKRDAVYGALWTTVLRFAQAQHLLHGQTALEVAEGAEEIVVGINPGDDAAIVFRGVPASLDPRRMTDASGHPLFRLVDDKGRAPEYEPLDRKNAAPGSVFVLPDRTWVVAVGDARPRARQAFASPFGRPAPKVDRSALAAVRFGESFVQAPRYVKSPVWGPLTRKLAAATLALLPGKGGLVVTLHYGDEDATAWAEMHAKRLVDELAALAPEAAPRRPGPRPDPGPLEGRFAWLKGTVVEREGNAVRVRLAIPARLLEELPNASARDLPL